MIEIRQADLPAELKEIQNIIQKSFLTVADDFGFTKENAPTNPAFISLDKVKESIENGTEFFIAKDSDNKAGCIAIEKDPKSEDNYFLERLAVLPEHRHNRIGQKLLDYAASEIKKRNGISAGIAIVDENKRLKEWYINYGFKVNGVKTFPHLPFTVCFLSLEV
ncbi:MAG: GNAT family N-acetyltransferase [Spirochaetales bacterium]|nr:GNAT family N-acetyltransferase [Spirochaetales bacterium]